MQLGAMKPKLKRMGIGLGLPLVLILFMLTYLTLQKAQYHLQAMADGRVVVLSLSDSKERFSRLISSKPDPVKSERPKKKLPDEPLMPVPPGQGLRPAPNSALVEQTEIGALPKISSDGVRPWRYYARSFTASDNVPLISVVITGLGMSKKATDLALRLSPDVTLSFSPYARDASLWVISARSLGHEVMVDLPMELRSYPQTDSGPLALHPGNSTQVNTERLNKVLSHFTGYVGTLAPADERFTEFRDVAVGPIGQLSRRGLMMVMASPSLQETALGILNNEDMPYVQADLSVTEPMKEDALTNRFLSIENVARRRGHALIVLEPYPSSLEALEKWLQTLDKKGFLIAPVSALAHKQFS